MAENLTPVAAETGEGHKGFCAFCGEPYPARAVFCAGCGKRLPEPAEADPTEVEPAPSGLPARAAAELPKGGVPRRIAAFLIDLVIISIVASTFAAVAGETAANAAALLLYVGAPLYMIAFECSSLEATPGKLALGIRVVNERGTRIGIGQGVGRTLLSVLSSFFFCAGFWMAGFRGDGRALHDLGSSTWVVRKGAR